MTDILGGRQPYQPPVTREELLSIHEDLTLRARLLMKQKNHDYTTPSGNSPFENFEDAAAVTKTDARLVCLSRLVEKCSRIRNWIENGTFQVQDENTIQTLIDMINFPIILAGMEMERQRASKLMIAPGPRDGEPDEDGPDRVAGC